MEPAAGGHREGNNLPCVLPGERGRQFRVRGDVQVRLLRGFCEHQAINDLDPEGGQTL